MANIEGMSTTNQINAEDLVVDMSNKVIDLEPDRNQMVRFLRNLKKSPTKNFKFWWQKDAQVDHIDAVSATVSASSVDTVSVDNGDQFAINDLVLVVSGSSAGEVFKVTAVSGDDLTVARGRAGTPSTMADNDVLVKIGSSWGEGSSVRNSSNGIISLETVKTDDYNFTQVEKTVLATSGTQLAMGQNGGLYSGDPRKYQAMMQGKVHARKMNHTCYFGKRYETGNERGTGGFIEFISNTSSTTSLTLANLDSDIATYYRYGMNHKTLFCSRRVARKITSQAHGLITVNDPADASPAISGGYAEKGRTLGVRVRRFEGDGGSFDIIVDDTLDDLSAYAGYGLHIDMTDVAYRFLPGRDTRLIVDAQLPDVDGKVDYYLTEWGIQRGHASHHAMWTSVAA